MNCQAARHLIPELLDAEDGKLRTADPRQADFQAVREHLANCPDCQRECSTLRRTLAELDSLPVPEPSPELRRGFQAMLDAEKSAGATSGDAARASVDRQLRFWRWVFAPLAAGSLLVAGFALGARFAGPPRAVAVVDPETRRELHELRDKIDRIEGMNQLVAATLRQDREPAGKRLEGVVTSGSEENPPDRVLDELIASLALDPSANVRLRALEALYPHSDRSVVRAGVLGSLSHESNPLVQLAMIDFLAAARDHDAKPALERLSLNELANASVREAAKRALAQL